jgi:hypothetical protein
MGRGESRRSIEYRLVPWSTGTGKLELENLVSIPRRLKKKRQKDFIVIWSDSSCVEIRYQVTTIGDWESYACTAVKWKMCTGLLSSNGLHNPVFLLLRIRPCLRSRCLAMRWSNPLNVWESVSITPAFSTSALDEGEWLASRSCSFNRSAHLMVLLRQSEHCGEYKI